MSLAGPSVSIAIRAYRRRFLGEAVESVLGQSHRDLELVVYDDAGDLGELVEEFGDPRIRYHRPATRRPTTSGRFQAAISLCRGRYVGVLDDDDRYEPGFVTRLIAALEEDPLAGIAFCRVAYDLDGRTYVPPDPRAAGPQPDALREILAYRAFVWPSSMLVRRAALEAAEAHRPMPEGVAPDTFVNVHAAVAGWRHVLVDEPLSVRRWHRDQGSTAGLATIRETVATWDQLSVGDGELERLRRTVLARKLLWRAVYEGEAGDRDATRAAVAAAATADESSWRIPRRLLGLAARVPVLGPLASRAFLGLVRARGRRSRPPSPARGGAGSGLQVARDAATYGAGSVTAQLVLVLVAPILTRLYSPAELGAAGVIVGAMVVVGVLACLRFDVAIPLAQGRRDVAGLCALSVLAGLGFAALLAVASLLLGPPLVELANVPEMKGWTWLVAVQAAIAAIGLTGAGVLIRRRRYGALAGVRLSQAVAQSGTQVAAGAAGAGGPGFAVGAAAGTAAYAAAAARGAASASRRPALADALAAMRGAARRWRRFAAWSSLATALQTGALALLPLLVAATYGPAAAGLFILAQRVIGLPVAVAGEALSWAWFGTAAEIVRERRPGLRESLVSVTRPLVIGGGALLALILIAGPPLFPALFGDAWTGGGELLLALAPLHFALFVALPAGQTIQALGRADVLTAIAGARLAVGVGALLGGDALDWSLTAALGLYAAGMAAISVAVAVVAWRLSE